MDKSTVATCTYLLHVYLLTEYVTDVQYYYVCIVPYAYHGSSIVHVPFKPSNGVARERISNRGGGDPTTTQNKTIFGPTKMHVPRTDIEEGEGFPQ